MIAPGSAARAVDEDDPRGTGAASISETIQRDVEMNIVSGNWAPGDRIPSESEFMTQYNCSRMTVNRVLSRLSERGLIVRRRKAGSFVATPRNDSAMFLEIRDFAREAAGQGRRYRHEILLRRPERLSDKRAASLRLEPGLPVLRVLPRRWRWLRQFFQLDHEPVDPSAPP